MMPTGAVAKAKTQTALCEIAAAGYNAKEVPIAINANAISMKWYVERVPCLTATRAKQGGFWLSSLERFLTTSEMLRLQGIDPNHMQTGEIALGGLAHMIGNAFTQTVFERLLLEALPAAGFVPRAMLRDRFA